MSRPPSPPPPPSPSSPSPTPPPASASAGAWTRAEGRAADQTRRVVFELGAQKYAEGSVLVHCGDTRVMVAASVENRVPGFLAGSGRGWLTAEYAMLPRATSTRNTREVAQGRPSGRSAEIQRLIGRGLRAAIDLGGLGERTLAIDCDVLQADGGTRTAAITGAWVATVLACARLHLQGDLARWPILDQVAAVSVGIVRGQALLDLDASEDQGAEVDMNVIATAGGRLVEVQGTGEKRPFTRPELDALIDLAFLGTAQLASEQSRVLAGTLAEVAEATAQRARRGKGGAAPRSEEGLWGPP